MLLILLVTDTQMCINHLYNLKIKANKHKQIKSGDLIKDLVVSDWLTVIRQQSNRKDNKAEDLKKKKKIHRKRKRSLVFLCTEEER